MSTPDRAAAPNPCIRALAAVLVSAAERRRERAAKQLDGILMQLAAGGGRVGAWAEALRRDGEGAGGGAAAAAGEKGVAHAK